MKNTRFIKNPSYFSKNLGINLIKKIYVFDELNSTNDYAKELAIKGEDEGTIVISRIQLTGRGRFDRIWESPEGGVYLSLILRPKVPPEKSMLLSLMTAIVVSKTISGYNLTPDIKWPNDIRINKKKIAGILIESETCKNKIDYIVIGIGINLNNKIKDLSGKIRKLSTSILKENGSPIDYCDFLSNLLNNFNKYNKLFTDEKYNQILKEWKSQSDTIGKKIIINLNSNPIKGTVIDINESGFLNIMLENGKNIVLKSGEIKYLEI